MPYAPERAQLVQLGREASFPATGTPTAATTKYRGVALVDVEDDRNRILVPENIGLSGNTDRIYDGAYGAKMPFPRAPFTFQQGPHILEAAIRTATPGASTAYLRTYDLPQDNSVRTLKTYTIEAGNAVVSGDAAAMAGAFVDDFTLDGKAGKAGDAWSIAANWIGQQWISQAFTGSLTAPSVEEAIFNKTKLYIDDSGGTIGTTLKSGVMLGASIKLKTGWMGVPTAEGYLFYTVIKFAPPDRPVTFELDFELESTSGVVAAERAKMNATTIRLIRLDCPGSSADLNLQINMAVRWLKFAPYNRQNGNIGVKATGYALVSAADSRYFDIAVKNGVATLP